MTTNRVLSAVSFLGLACVSALVAPSSASAQCQPDDIFCAELRIGPAQPPPPPPVIVRPPPPPPVVVQPPPPPPVVVQPPPPPVVIIAPAQPPPPPPRQVVVVAPPRREPQVLAVQVERRRVTRYELVPAFDFGVHLALSGMALAEDSGMAGFSAGFRLRPIEHIGLDLTIGAFGGQSWLYDGDGGDRWEVPIVADVLFFFNPQHRVQFYALIGVGGSYAVQQFTRTGSERDFGYVGGEAGLGLELRIGRHFALNLDVRGFIRQQVQDDEGPEFTRRTSSGTQSTDTSGGVYGNVGMTFYFGG